MSKTAGQFIEETIKILGEGVNLLEKVQDAKSSGSFLGDANRDAANNDLKKLLQEGMNEFSEARSALKAKAQQGHSSEMGRSGLFSSMSTLAQEEQKSIVKSQKSI